MIGGLLLGLKNEVVRVAPRARVNAVCPGWTVSPMTRSTLEDSSVLDRATNTMALRKAAEPEDIARQVVVLASDEISGHVTGQVVVVAGGMEGRLLHSS
jgi:3-oxoacyl-[acyl-carrier protein] reductase